MLCLMGKERSSGCEKKSKKSRKKSKSIGKEIQKNVDNEM